MFNTAQAFQYQYSTILPTVSHLVRPSAGTQLCIQAPIGTARYRDRDDQDKIASNSGWDWDALLMADG